MTTIDHLGFADSSYFVHFSSTEWSTTKIRKSRNFQSVSSLQWLATSKAKLSVSLAISIRSVVLRVIPWWSIHCFTVLHLFSTSPPMLQSSPTRLLKQTTEEIIKKHLSTTRMLLNGLWRTWNMIKIQRLSRQFEEKLVYTFTIIFIVGN